jgi:hypothetical protein
MIIGTVGRYGVVAAVNKLMTALAIRRLVSCLNKHPGAWQILGGSPLSGGLCQDTHS